MIRTKDLEEFIDCAGNVFVESDLDEEYRNEIIKRLRAYDRICRDLEQLIATLSNVVD